MKSQSQTKILLLAISQMAVLIGFAHAQGRSEEAILLDEALKALREARAGAAQLDAENQQLKNQVTNIGKSLVEANRVANQCRDDYNKLRLEIEALGLETLTKGEEGVRGLFLKSISDLRIVEEQRDATEHALADLSDSIKAFMATVENPDVEMRVAVQAALKKAAQAIANNQERPAPTAKKSLDEGKVVSIHRESGVLVFNLGEKDDAKRGMTFDIIRKDRAVGTAMVAYVRDNVCGALITKLIDESDDAQVGDRVRVKTQKNL